MPAGEAWAGWGLARLHLEPSSPQQSPTRMTIVAAEMAASNGAAGINFEYRGCSTVPAAACRNGERPLVDAHFLPVVPSEGNVSPCYSTGDVADFL